MGSTTSRPPAPGSESAAQAPAGPPSALDRLRRRLSPHRRRIARLLVVALLLAVGVELAPNIPRKAEVEFALGADHGDIVEIRVTYLRDDEVFHSVRFDHPGGAPDALLHRLSLPQGAYEVNVELTDANGEVERVSRHLDSPVDGRLRLHVGSAP